MINCPNPSCKTANPEEVDTCQVCNVALPHHYLWGMGSLVSTLKPGQLLNQRYLLKRDRTFLDTNPGIIPESLPEIPDFLLPYLHLSAYPLHLPRPYSVMRTPDGDYVLMLESSALSMATKQAGEVPFLLPKLTNRWADAPPLRQLSWLWQIAQVWDAFYADQVAETLIDSELLRVDGSVVRLLALSGRATVAEKVTETSPPTLIELARFWQPLVDTAHSAVSSFLDRLCEQMERQQINAEQLSEQLAQAMTVCAQEQGVSYDLAVYTDQGPTRKRNEDACYPTSGTTKTVSSQETKQCPQLLIVCDGIGGHQGGDVASKLAISTIENRLLPLLGEDQPELTATELTLAIEGAICAANDEISAQNDQAQRQARDRMGTTLVMALVKGADVYIAHLGDSRAYRVSQRNCQQVTLDDDVASRQVRLGGSLYREVLMQPGSGSLIQALGMGSSHALRPTVQRFVLDESCVFLLCSDGLSDSDRVEQFWQSTLRPLVVGSGSTAEVGKYLVDIANKYNGHDNVTVGLLNAQVVRASDRIVPRDVASVSSAAGAATGSAADSEIPKTAPPGMAVGRSGRPQTRLMGVSETTATGTKIGPNAVTSAQGVARQAGSTSASAGKSTVAKSAKVPIILAALLLLGGVASALFLFLPGLRGRLGLPIASTAGEVGDSGPVNAAGNSPVSSAEESVTESVNLVVGSYVRIRRSEIPSEAAEGEGVSLLTLYPNPVIGGEDNANTLTGTIPPGGIVQVVSKQTTEDQSDWVQLKVCSIPGVSSASGPDAGSGEGQPPEGLNTPESTQTDQPLVLPPGSEGWIVESRVAAVSESIKDLQPTQQGNCGS